MLFAKRFLTHDDPLAEIIACRNGRNILFLNFRKTRLLLGQVSINSLSSGSFKKVINKIYL